MPSCSPVRTAATIFDLRATSAASQRFVLPPLRTPQRITLMAPTISRWRMSVWPIFLTEPSLVLPPVDLCRGTMPTHAAKLGPLSNVSRSGANAATAPAVTGPIPGRVQSRRSYTLDFEATSFSPPSGSMISVSLSIYLRWIAPIPRTAFGRVLVSSTSTLSRTFRLTGRFGATNPNSAK